MSAIASGSIFAFSFNVYDAMATKLQEATAGILGMVINLIVLAPDPTLKAAWFRGEFGVVMQVAMYLMVPIIFAATIGALMRGGLQQVLRTYLWALPIGIFGGVAAIAIIDIAIKVDHELTLAVFGITQDANGEQHVMDSGSIKTIQSFYDQMANSVKAADAADLAENERIRAEAAAQGKTICNDIGNGAPPIDPATGVPMNPNIPRGDCIMLENVSGTANQVNATGWSLTQVLCMFVLLVLLFFLLIETFFRQVMIYMGALFIPFSLAAFIWGPIRVWFYNLCELIITMVFAKFVIAAIMSFGFTAMAYGLNGGESFSSFNLGLVMGALVVMTIACMSGPALVTFVMAPSHSILSFKAAKQVTPWNHDRKFAGSLFKSNFDSLKGALKGGKTP
jgi:hypothetical protein